MRVKPIPRQLLPHSATYYPELPTTDDWENPTGWGPPLILRFVRFEPTTKVVLGKNNQEVQCSLLMYYDVRNSTGATEEYFLVGRRLDWTDGPHTVQSAEKLYESGVLHHWELLLV